MSELDNLTFEQAFTELEAVVRQMEAGDLALEQAVALFERGVALAAYCNAQLDSAELRVRQLLPGLEEKLGEQEWEPGGPGEAMPPGETPQ